MPWPETVQSHFFDPFQAFPGWFWCARPHLGRVGGVRGSGVTAVIPEALGSRHPETVCHGRRAWQHAVHCMSGRGRYRKPYGLGVHIGVVYPCGGGE